MSSHTALLPRRTGPQLDHGAVLRLPWSRLIEARLGDFPDQVAMVMALQGCNATCGHCLAGDLQATGPGRLSPHAVWDVLQAQAGRVEALVITGGEPCLHGDLPAALATIRRLGYRIKLETNGSAPEVLTACLQQGLVDRVSLSIPAPWHRYPEVSGRGLRATQVRRSLERLIASGVTHEIITVVAPPLSPEDVLEVVEQARGAQRHCLQHDRSEQGPLRARERSWCPPNLYAIATVARRRGHRCFVR